MIPTKLFGNQAEEFVKNHLTKDGFTILAMNYRQRIGEIDIIAYKKDLCIFVEVKARASGQFLHQSVSPSKQEKIKLTARYFLHEKRIADKNCRFDVALFSGTCPNWQLTYIPNAFY